MLRLKLLFALLIVAGCTNEPPVTSNPYVATALTRVERLAVAPGGGTLAEAVAAELRAVHGFQIIPPATLFSLMDAAGVAMIDGPQLGGLTFLQGRGIDAVLSVRGGEGGGTGLTATALVLRVPDGARIAQSTWTPRLALVEAGRNRLAPNRVAGLLAAGLAQDLRR
jgi:hypothetical protein